MNLSLMKKVGFLLIAILCFYVLAVITFYFGEPYIMYDRNPVKADYKYSFDFNFEEIKFDDGKLIGLLFKNPDPKGVVLFCKGSGGELSNFNPNESVFIQNGYDFLIWDYRGNGKSKGHYCNENELFSDAQMVYDYLAKQYNSKNIILYGYSLGSGIAGYLSANNTSEFLILESPYFEYANKWKKNLWWLPIKNISRFPIKTFQYVEKCQCPIYIFHGKSDNSLDISNSIKLSDFIKPNDQLFIIDSGNHKNLKNSDLFINTINSILK